MTKDRLWLQLVVEVRSFGFPTDAIALSSTDMYVVIFLCRQDNSLAYFRIMWQYLTSARMVLSQLLDLNSEFHIEDPCLTQGSLTEMSLGPNYSIIHSS